MTDHHHRHQDDRRGPRANKNRDNAGLSRNRRREVVENDKYAAFAKRIVRAYARRVGAGDIEALASMVHLANDLETAIGDAVIGLREFGYSWTEIGNRLGISRQAARQRWTTADSTASRRANESGLGGQWGPDLAISTHRHPAKPTEIKAVTRVNGNIDRSEIYSDLIRDEEIAGSDQAHPAD